MAVKYSVQVRNAMLDSIETTIGASPRLIFYTGSPPANTASAATGTVIATMVLPADWMSNAASGVKSLSGTWTTTASNAGIVGYYRMWNSSVTTCHEQGTVTITGGGGDITLDNDNVAAGQTVTITSMTVTAGNA
jgi:hypothetical protein